MMKRFSPCLLLLLAACAKKPVTTVMGLRSDGDNSAPRFSWEINNGHRGVMQTAYEIQASNGNGYIWQSGKQLSDQSLYVPYAGQVLNSGEVCSWKVRVWTSDGQVSPWSAPASWITPAGKTEWHASWIGLDSAFAGEHPQDTFTRLAARYFRKELELKGPIEKAVLYISGLGLYEPYLNGEKIGKQVLAPGPTQYDKRVFYNAFDVTSYLRKGGNTLGVLLGNGRFFNTRGPVGPPPMTNADYGYPKLIAQLQIYYKDGHREDIVSDSSWRVTRDGPIIANNEYDGEEYDARKELNGWNKNGYDAHTWLPVQMVAAPADNNLVLQPDAPIMVMDIMKPYRVTQVKPGLYIYDMGQNFTGWVRLKVHGPAGTQVKMRFAERLQDDSTLYTANLRSARVTDIYTLKGSGEEEWEPRFTYHGFRYVEVTGYPGVPSLDDIEGRVVYDDMETTGRFKTSNPVINQIYNNAYWGIRSNYRGMPTDCPQRDERMGWLGDRATGSGGEAFVFNNHGMYAKWMQDIEDAQHSNGSVPDVAPTYWKIYSDNITWPSAYPSIVDMLWRQYGDSLPVKQHYASIKKWMDYMKDKYMQQYIVTKDTYGDWCVPPESPHMILSEDPARRTDGAFLSTSFYYYLLGLMDNFARIAGHPEDTTTYQDLRAKIYTAFNGKFLNKDLYYANNTPTANILALAYGLVQPANESAVFDHVVNKTLKDYNGHVSTGLVGAEWLMRTLSDNGRPDIALRMASDTTYPSWGYMAKQGATTIWELWNGNTADPAMNSGNHVMLLGDLVTWYYEYLGGIRPDKRAPGYKNVVLKPLVVTGLDSVAVAYHSPYGWVRSAWKKTGSVFQWEVTVPPNTTADLYFPQFPGFNMAQMNSDKLPEQAIGQQGKDYVVYRLPAGSYRWISARQ
jgi:alpha-L-rhamnosidase